MEILNHRLVSKILITLSLFLQSTTYSLEFGLTNDERAFQGSENDFSKFGITNFQRTVEIANMILEHPDNQYLNILNRLSPRTINLLDMLDFKNIFDIKVKSDFFNAKFGKLPETQRMVIIEDSLDNPKFSDEVKAKDFCEEKRYVRCDIKGISGWINHEVLDLIEKVQEPVDQNVDFVNQDTPFNNKIILHGPPGNGKTTLVEKIAEVSDAHLIKITGSSLHAKFANHGAKKIREHFAQALHYAGSHKYKKVIIFIDEVDSFAKNDICAKEAHFLSTTQELWQCLDKIRFEQQIFVILATNDYESLHDTLTSRFNNNIIKFNNPSKAVRKEIINYYAKIFNVPLLESELNKLLEQSEGFGIRDIELLFISASQKIKKIVSKVPEILKKDRNKIINIINVRLKFANEELKKRKANEAKKTIDDEIKETNLILLRNQLAKDKALNGGIIGGGIGGLIGLGAAGPAGVIPGATIGGGIGWSSVYLYEKGYAKEMVATVSVVMLLVAIASQTLPGMIPSAL